MSKKVDERKWLAGMRAKLKRKEKRREEAETRSRLRGA